MDDRQTKTTMKERRHQRAKEANNRLGETILQNCGEIAFIVEYRNAKDITIQFKNSGELVECAYGNFKKGVIKSHFTPTIYGFGVVGLDKTIDKNGKHLKSYNVWSSMIQRCYSKKFHLKYPTYKDCSVCGEWLFYPNFKEWFDENYYEIDNYKMTLDKDILIKGNKVYSPNTCVFVPERINLLFTKKDANRGKLPIGVYWNETKNKYQANCSIFDITTNKSKGKNLGYYNTPEEAYQSYKKEKENNIKQVADYYKDQIPSKLHEAMYRYEVEIAD